MMGYWNILVYSMPLLLLPVLQLPGWLNLAIIAVLFFCYVRTWRLQVRRRHANAVRSLKWGAENHCLLGLYSGQEQHLDLCEQAFLAPWLVILHFNNQRYGRRTLVLLPDMVDRDLFRKLRVRLKLELNSS